jgi:small neutral amino acid transporter SnatA (MarC family)
LPTLTRSYPRRFTFYVAELVSSILDAIGIHMHSLKVAGGIILFLFGVQMLFGKMDKAASSPEEERDLAVKDVNHCVFPPAANRDVSFYSGFAKFC